MAKPVESSQFLEVVGLYPRDTGSLTTDSVYFDLKGAFVIDTMNGLKINSGAGNQVGGFTIAGTMTLTGVLAFSPDNTYDIGASGASRPRNVYAAQNVFAGTNLQANTSVLVTSGFATNVGIQLNNAGSYVYSGTGVPANGTGNDGDFYFRKDGGAGTSIYQRRVGAWVATVA